MSFIKEQIEKYEALDIPQTKESDFEDFWKVTIEKTKTIPLNIEKELIDYPISKITVYDATYEGLDGTKIHTWILLPPEAKDKKVPVVITYHGAGGSRHTPSCHSQYVSMGCAVIATDVRMQRGLTGSKTGFTGGSQQGLFIFGILDRDNSYLYCVITDALRAIEVALTIPEIDNNKICVQGGSQGGALSLMTASLRNDVVALCMADVPSNCWLEKRVFDGAGGAESISNFLNNNPDKVDIVLKNLSYFDNINLVDKIKCPSLISLGLKDPVCPPENVYAACNKITAPKTIIPYPYGKHNGGDMNHNEIKLQYLKDNFNL